MKILHDDTNPKLQYETLWIITNITSTDRNEFGETLVKKGILPVLLGRMKSEYNDVMAQGNF